MKKKKIGSASFRSGGSKHFTRRFDISKLARTRFEERDRLSEAHMDRQSIGKLPLDSNAFHPRMRKKTLLNRT